MKKHRRKLRGRALKKQRRTIIFLMLGITTLLSVGYASFQTNINLKVKGTVKNETCVDGYVWEFNQKDEGQEFKAPCKGTYKIEAWGAGGNSTGNSQITEPGNGGFASGNINLKKSNKLYIYVGKTMYYNGGGGGEAPGGGATDIRLTNGSWNDFTSLKSRIMVASGGGGGFYKTNTSNHKPGHGGGLKGYDADADYIYTNQSPLYEKGYSGHGGTQTSGGISDIIITTGMHEGYSSSTIITPAFGYGGYNIPRYYSSGGGSGYYGGGHGVHPGSTWSGGGGGSSFISGHDGCDAIDKDSKEDNIIHTGQSIHYSGYKFTETIMIDGAGCKWTNEKTEECNGMPTHDGTGTMTGNEGDGFAKITLLSRK